MKVEVYSLCYEYGEQYKKNGMWNNRKIIVEQKHKMREEQL